MPDFKAVIITRLFFGHIFLEAIVIPTVLLYLIIVKSYMYGSEQES